MFRGRRVRMVWWLTRRPIVTFAVEFVVLAPLILAGAPSGAAGGAIFLLPWVLALFAVVNLPLLSAAFRGFRMTDATRRNHALEHATIIFLRDAGVARIGGSAAPDGFRVHGRASPRQIRAAFDRVRAAIANGDHLPYISRHCGSNLVTALGLALVLLLSVALVSLLLEPPLVVRAGALAGVVVCFVAMRHGFGNWVQRRFFMKTDFQDVSLRDIREVSARPMERRPVHFVETIVRLKPPNQDHGSRAVPTHA